MQALTEVVWGPPSVRKWYTKKSGWRQIFFDVPEVRDMTGAAHAGLGKASGSLPTKEPQDFHTLRPCRGRPCPVQALPEVVWGPRSVRMWSRKNVNSGTFFSMHQKFVTRLGRPTPASARPLGRRQPQIRMFFAPLRLAGDVLVRCRSLLRWSGGRDRLESSPEKKWTVALFFRCTRSS